MVDEIIEEEAALLVDDDDNVLEHALRATLSATLHLPAWTTFHPLAASGVAVAVRSTRWFDAHHAFELPCDYRIVPRTGTYHGRRESAVVDVLHRFTLVSPLAEPLNSQLTSIALHAEANARTFADYGDGTHQTNWGGYHSEGTIFDAHDDPPTHRSLRWCRALHAIASAAIDEIRGGGAAPEAGAARSSGRAVAAAEPMSTPPTATELHAAHGWINVNRASDLNFIHVHNPLRFSAVYFVAGGRDMGGDGSGNGSAGGSSGGSASGSGGDAIVGGGDAIAGGGDGHASRHPGGHLIFRGGRQPAIDASHSYLTVPPTPGTLWVFPGSVPHAVLGYIVARDPPRDALGRSDHRVAAAAAEADGRVAEAARISIAINFEEQEALAQPAQPLPVPV